MGKQAFRRGGFPGLLRRLRNRGITPMGISSSSSQGSDFHCPARDFRVRAYRVWDAGAASSATALSPMDNARPNCAGNADKACHENPYDPRIPAAPVAHWAVAGVPRSMRPRAFRAAAPRSPAPANRAASTRVVVPQALRFRATRYDRHRTTTPAHPTPQARRVSRERRPEPVRYCS
jgi:hypothetical protein